jgi:methyl-accepting chemotaxis protein
MTKKKLFRFPMFFKFLVGCLVLAGLLIAGGTWFVRSETRLRSQGNWLAKHMRRYHGYEDRVGRAMTATAELLAGDAELAAALAPPPTGEAGTMPAPDGVRTLAKEMHERLTTKYALNPDLFVIFSASGGLVWAPPGSPVGADDLGELGAVEKARAGNLFAHRIQLVDGNAFQVSAVPIRSGEDVVGGLLLGVKLQRYFEEYAEQSDDNPDMRMRVTLLQGSKVMASAFATDRWAELGKAMQPDKFVRVKVGEDVRDVVRLRDGDIDFYFEEIEGYKGLDSTTLGHLFITRSRRSVNDPGARIPWLQIGVGVGLSLVIASLMAYWITRPIKQMVRQSRDLLAGDTDLTQRIVVDSRDETADLADNINQAFQRVHGLATEVQSAAFQVGASSAEISAASKQTLGGLKEQTSKIGGSTAAVTELSASIQQVAANAAQATEVAEQTNTAIGSAVQRMDQIRRSVDDAADKMRDLGESSKRIGNIVEVIRQISEQTSMLALNASIEAAHAGEQGRGFAVVADEVSSLARRVGQSAKDIEALIQTIKEQTQAAMASMDVGTRDVDTGSQLVTSTLTGLGQLITVVKDTAHAVQEQAVVSDEIARNMDTVQHIATEVLTGSEESVVQAERLHELAYQLEQSIGGFNLDGSGRVGAGRPEGGERRQLPPKEARQLPPRVKREG